MRLILETLRYIQWRLYISPPPPPPTLKPAWTLWEVSHYISESPKGIIFLIKQICCFCRPSEKAMLTKRMALTVYPSINIDDAVGANPLSYHHIKMLIYELVDFIYWHKSSAKHRILSFTNITWAFQTEWKSCSSYCLPYSISRNAKFPWNINKYVSAFRPDTKRSPKLCTHHYHQKRN